MGGTTRAPLRFEHALKIRDIETAAQIKHYKDKWRLEWDKRKKLHNMVRLQPCCCCSCCCSMTRSRTRSELSSAAAAQAHQLLLLELPCRVPVLDAPWSDQPWIPRLIRPTSPRSLAARLALRCWTSRAPSACCAACDPLSSERPRARGSQSRCGAATRCVACLLACLACTTAATWPQCTIIIICPYLLPYPLQFPCPTSSLSELCPFAIGCCSAFLFLQHYCTLAEALSLCCCPSGAERGADACQRGEE